MSIISLSKKLVTGAILAASLLPPAVWATQTLNYSDHEPLGGMRTRFLNDVLFPAIEKESGGRLKINAFWAGRLASGYQALGVVGTDNFTDMATVVPEYVADKLPLHQIFKSFPVGPSGQAQVEFFRRSFAQIPAFASELDQQNVVNLFSATGYPLSFFSVNPLDSLQHIRGNWRSASFWHHDFLRYAGANPVTIPWGDAVYQAMKAKTLEGLMVNIDSGYLLNVHDVAPNVLVSKQLWLGHVYLVAMNKQTWQTLPPQDQQAIIRATQLAYQSLGAVMGNSFDKQTEQLRQAGANLRILTATDVEHWKAQTQYQQSQSDWVKAQEAKGVSDAGAVMQAVTALMNQTMR